jgi:hypothetical protein
VTNLAPFIRTITKEIKADTSDILSDTVAIKQETSEILDGNAAIKQDTSEILALITRLEQLQQVNIQPGAKDQFMLQRYLDELSTYAGSIYQESVADPLDRLKDLDSSGDDRSVSSLTAIAEEDDDNNKNPVPSDTQPNSSYLPPDPNAPKAGFSAYLFFASDERGKIREENPGITFGTLLN